MREIKFRAWHLKGKHWLPTWYCRPLDGGALEDYDEDENSEGDLVGSRSVICKADEYVLVQYTGLHDKNGKEIYEGDICLSHGGIVAPIQWSDEDCWFFFACRQMVYPDLEVVGNIYENPDLLNAGSPS